MDFFWKSSVTGGFWAPVRSHGRCFGDGSQRMLLLPPADPGAGWGWHSHCLRGQEHTSCTWAGSPCSILHTKHIQHPGGLWGHFPESLALCQGCHICYLATIWLSSYASCISPQRRQINSLPQSGKCQEKSLSSGLCCFLISGLLGLGACEPEISPCWACGVQHLLVNQIFSFCKLFISQRKRSGGKYPAYNLCKQIPHFYCCHPYLLISRSVSLFATLYQSPELVHKISNTVYSRDLSYSRALQTANNFFFFFFFGVAIQPHTHITGG